MTSPETTLESSPFVTQLYHSVTQFLYIRKIYFHFLLAILSVLTVLFIYSNYIYFTFDILWVFRYAYLCLSLYST